MQVTLLVEPAVPAPGLRTAVSPRQFDAVDEFAGQLGAGVEVSVVEGSLADAPAEGFIVVFSSRGLAEHAELGPRVVLINADRSNIMAQLERFQLVGAVEKDRYFRWRTRRAEERGAGLHGRTEVAARMGVAVGAPFRTEHYGLIASERCADLPSLLAAYLAAYEELPGAGA